MPCQVWLGIDIGVRNLSYCYLRQGEWGNFYVDTWEHKDLLTEFTPYLSFRDMDCMEIHVLAQLVLPQLFPRQGSNIHHVVIEKQPGGRAGGSQKLEMFSQLIFKYFDDWRNNLRFGEQLCSVRIQSAQSKYCNKWLQRYGWSKEKGYRKRKALGVTLAQQLLEDSKIKVLCSIPTNVKKKDDLADAFLLAFYAAEFKPSFGAPHITPATEGKQERPQEPQGPQGPQGPRLPPEPMGPDPEIL